MLGPLPNLLHALWWQPEEKALLVGGKMVKSFWSVKTSSIYLLWLPAYIRLLITHMSVYWVVQVRQVFPHSLSNEWMGSFGSNQCLSSRWREDLEGWGKAMKKDESCQNWDYPSKSPSQWRLETRYQTCVCTVDHFAEQNWLTTVLLTQSQSFISSRKDRASCLLLPAEIISSDWFDWRPKRTD